MGLLLLYRVGINKNAFILLITQPVKCLFSLGTVNVRRRIFWVLVMVFLFKARDVIEYYCRHPGGGGGVKLQRRYVAFGRSDLTVSYLHRQSLILRFNYAKSKAWLFSETEIVNSKHVNSEYAIYY